MRVVSLSMVAALLLMACGDSDAGGLETPGCADVVAASSTSEPGGTYGFEVTVLSDDVGVERYADQWEVRDLGGDVLGTRVLAHPHVDEQPFTRSLAGVAVPDGVTEVLVAARDSVNGYCGAIYLVRLGE